MLFYYWNVVTATWLQFKKIYKGKEDNKNINKAKGSITLNLRVHKRQIDKEDVISTLSGILCYLAAEKE